MIYFAGALENKTVREIKHGSVRTGTKSESVDRTFQVFDIGPYSRRAIS
jgi:hypothetical protein